MNNAEIDNFLRGRAKSFRGVYSCDTLPDGPGLYVVNTDPHYKSGEHWIAIYIDGNGRGEYFDSFGRLPTDNFKLYMDRNCINWIYNSRQLQSIASRFCGHYCIVYCMLRSRGVDLRRIVSRFTNDTGFNDVIVHGLICGIN